MKDDRERLGEVRRMTTFVRKELQGVFRFEAERQAVKLSRLIENALLIYIGLEWIIGPDLSTELEDGCKLNDLAHQYATALADELERLSAGDS